MTDILYIIGDGANEYDNLPLRWSLRSLEKHAKNVERVIICGTHPDWLSDKVVKVNYKSTRCKDLNILYGYKAAVDALQLEKPTLFSSDDHYLCKDVDIDKWPHYYNGELPTLETYIKKYKKFPDIYKVLLMNTQIFLNQHNLPTRRYCLHLNTWFEPKYVDKVIHMVENYNSKFNTQGYEHTCLLNAIYENENPNIEWTYYKYDKKIRNVKDCQYKIDMNLPGFSTSPKSERIPSVINWMNNYFDVKSRWEK